MAGENISSITEEQCASMEEISSFAIDLSELASQLDQIVQKFKI